MNKTLLPTLLTLALGQALAQPTELERVLITGPQASTLPTLMPTTFEGIKAVEIERRINASDSADALKYFPSLLVRKRYIGDYDHAVLSTRASGTGNSARSLVYADGILLSNLLGNGASFTPRWGLVTPQEIERVDVLYGPFSAAYPGNSVGAVVDYVTRMPKAFEAHGQLQAAGQHFRYGGSDVRPHAEQASLNLGDRAGDFGWWLSLSRAQSQSHPLVFVTRAPSTTPAAPDALPVSGAVAQLNRFNQPWLLIGSSAHADTEQDQAKLKLAWQVRPGLRASLLLGLWDNQVARRSEGWLRDAGGRRVELGPENWMPSRALAIDGMAYALSAADFARSRERLQHRMQGLALKDSDGDGFDWQLTASNYDYARDQVRAWAPQAGNAQAGRLTELSGSGWTTLAARGSWRLGEHTLEAGLQQEQARLRNRVSAIAEWTRGEPTTEPASRFEGRSRLASLWIQDGWRFAADWHAVLGLRAERWRADQGLTRNGAAVHRHGARAQRAFSPKLALGWQFSDSGVLRLSSGRALRFPTVSELFQGGVHPGTGALLNGDPNLRPERSATTDLSADWKLDQGSLRATLFHEQSRDALYSQTNTLVTPPVTNVQNVGRIRTQGLELAAALKPLAALELQASLTWADSRIRANPAFPVSEGRWQPRVPRWRANLLASWACTEQTQATLGLRYAGRQYNSLDNSDPNGAVYQGVSPLWVADLRLLHRLNRQWSAALGVDNLNNRLHWNFHPYPARTVSAELRWSH